MNKPWWAPDARVLIALIIISGFFVVYGFNPEDDTLKGALIAAFAGAWGYFLGSSSGAKDANARVDKALDALSPTQPPP